MNDYITAARNNTDARHLLSDHQCAFNVAWVTLTIYIFYMAMLGQQTNNAHNFLNNKREQSKLLKEEEKKKLYNDAIQARLQLNLLKDLFEERRVDEARESVAVSEKRNMHAIN